MVNTLMLVSLEKNQRGGGWGKGEVGRVRISSCTHKRKVYFRIPKGFKAPEDTKHHTWWHLTVLIIINLNIKIQNFYHIYNYQSTFLSFLQNSNNNIRIFRMFYCGEGE